MVAITVDKNPAKCRLEINGKVVKCVSFSLNTNVFKLTTLDVVVVIDEPLLIQGDLLVTASGVIVPDKVAEEVLQSLLERKLK